MRWLQSGACSLGTAIGRRCTGRLAWSHDPCDLIEGAGLLCLILTSTASMQQDDSIPTTSASIEDALRQQGRDITALIQRRKFRR